MANLTEKMGNVWKEIKNQPKDIWFFYLFLLTFTLGVRKVLLFFPIKRAFNEYAGVYIYASDIFLCSTILVWIISILYNKIANMSSGRDVISEVIHRKDILEKDETEVDQKLSTRFHCFYKAILNKLWSVALASLSLIFPPTFAKASAGKRGTIKNYLHRKMFHVEQFGINDHKKCSTNLRQGFGGQVWNNFNLAWNIGCVFLFPLFLVILSFATTAWSENQLVSFYRSARLLELYLLFIYVSIRFVPYLTQYLCDCSTWNSLVQKQHSSSSDISQNVPRGTILDDFGVARGTFFNKMFHVEQLSDMRLVMGIYFKAILLGFISIMLFDHYFWDIWQGQLLFWLISGLLVGTSLGNDKKSMNCSTWNNIDNNQDNSMLERLIFSECNKKNIPFYLSKSQSDKTEIEIQPIVPPAYRTGRRGTIKRISLFFSLVITMGVLHSLLGMYQFFSQHSFGLFWLKESIISQYIPGVAKILVDSRPFVRAYGLFPHPNILGGFLLFSIVTTLLYKKLFHQPSQRLRRASVEQPENRKSSENVPPTFAKASAGKRGTILGVEWKSCLNPGIKIDFILLIQVFGILLSLSKSAILALVLALIYIFVPRGTISYLRGTRKFHDVDLKKNGEVEFLNCSTWNNFRSKFLKMFHVEHFGVGIGKFALYAGFLIIVFVSFAYFKFDFKAFFIKSLEERVVYLNVSKQIILGSPIIGIGTGQFIFESERLFPDLAIWQYQPVHNVFLLIWSEWGIVGLVLFIVFLWKLFHFDKS